MLNLLEKSAKRRFNISTLVVGGIMLLILLQAAKEFESELKKEPEPTEETSVEKPTSTEAEKRQDLKVSNQKETV